MLDVGREVMGAELPRALRQGQNCLAIGCIAAHLCKTRKGGAPSVMVAPAKVGQPPLRGDAEVESLSDRLKNLEGR